MPRALAYTIAVFAGAALGAGLAIAVAVAGGWLHGGTTKTIVIGPTAAGRSAPAVAHAPAPLLSHRFDAERIYAERSPGVVTIYSAFPTGEEGQGSGFVVSRAGYVLTNAHVVTTAPQQPVQPASELYVEFSDGDRVRGRIVGYDLFSDVGLVKVDRGSHPLTPLPLGDSSSAVVGEPVATIGSPFGNENSLSVGVVSATRRSISSITSEYQLVDAIQTDAAINHGTSGGPLVDSAGRVIGISAQIRSATGQGEGVGFAVPINTARRSMAQLLVHGHVSYAYVGISTDDLTPSLAHFLGDRVTRGALVTCVKPGSPGQNAGLRGGGTQRRFQGADVVAGGDVIVSIDGRPVHSGSDVVRLVGQRLVPGQTAVFGVVRDGKRRNVRIKLGQRPTSPSFGCD